MTRTKANEALAYYVNELKKKLGDKYSLEELHNMFLQQGFPPIMSVRKLMMGDDSPVL